MFDIFRQKKSFDELMAERIAEKTCELYDKADECRKVFSDYEIEIEPWPLLRVIVSKNGMSTPITPEMALHDGLIEWVRKTIH